MSQLPLDHIAALIDRLADEAKREIAAMAAVHRIFINRSVAQQARFFTPEETVKFIFIEGSDRKWYWQLRSRNGKVIADGAEGYNRKADCKRAANKLRTQASKAEMPH